jgi:EmrB/QacA subfamily drug resistance transporter
MHTNRTAVLWAALVATFLGAMEITIVGTAMPTIVGVLHGLDLFTWVVTGYLLTQTVSMPIYGKLADLYGRKKTFLGGATIFLFGSLLSGLAPSMPWLVAARVVQGLGAGALLPVAVTVIGDLYPGKERARAQGLLASVWGIASVTGPVLGVAIVSTLGWRWVFFINLPVGLAAMAIFAWALKEEVKPSQHGLDVPGAALLAAGVSVVLYAFRSTDRGWFDPLVLGLLAAGAVLLLLFIRQEQRAPEPLLPLTLFRDRFFSVSMGVGFLAGFGLTAFFTFIPLYIQGALGHPPAVTGQVLTVVSVTWSTTAFVAGRFIYPRTGTRGMGPWGMGLMVLGTAALALVGPQSGVIGVTAAGMVLAMGLGIMNSAYVIALQESADWSTRGVVTAAFQFIRNLGTGAAAAILGTVFNLRLLPRLAEIPDLASRTVRERLALTNLVLEPGGMAKIPAAVATGMKAAMADGLHITFMVVAVVTAVAFALSFAAPLRAGAGQRSGGREQVRHAD